MAIVSTIIAPIRLPPPSMQGVNFVDIFSSGPSGWSISPKSSRQPQIGIGNKTGPAHPTGPTLVECPTITVLLNIRIGTETSVTRKYNLQF